MIHTLWTGLVHGALQWNSKVASVDNGPPRVLVAGPKVSTP